MGKKRFLKVDRFILENLFEKKQINFISRRAAHSQIPRLVVILVHMSAEFYQLYVDHDV